MGHCQLTWTLPSLPGVKIVTTPPHAHIAWQPWWSAGRPPTLTLPAPGVHGPLIIGAHGAEPASDAATAGLEGAEHIPNEGTLVTGT